MQVLELNVDQWASSLKKLKVHILYVVQDYCSLV